MNIAVIASHAGSLLNFRRELLIELVGRGHQVVAMAPEDDSKVRHTLREIGVAFHVYPLFRNTITPLQDIKTVAFLIRFLRSAKIDLVFSYTIKPVVFGSIAANIAGVKHVTAMISGLGYAFISADGPKKKLIQAVAEALYRKGLSVCESIIFQNEDDEEEFRSRSLLPTTGAVTVVNGSGVDLEFHRPLPKRSGGPHFLMIARLLQAKGIREFAEAAARVRLQIPNATFEVVGPDDASPGALSIDEKQAVRDAGVELTGELQDVRPALARSTVFVLPSYREGTPRTVLEAMAAERPVITTDVPGCRQTTIDGETGLLVPPRDARALESAMLTLAQDTAFADHLRTAARRRVEDVYDVRLVAGDTADAILIRATFQGDGG